ncbi:hypothetical protein GALMADRAFT_82387 [Galerina marginata CBS 339.88]|uniref:Uncharacterized protein n=1 Tax=Galerina marginata (strain CBS 339.88) TaxID=685588 RepID=A0A067S2I8_GALM3|nr:hypothetical protein GALMADRAFT_82387 [Galerina marginata CBS 339.88]
MRIDAAAISGPSRKRVSVNSVPARWTLLAWQTRQTCERPCFLSPHQRRLSPIRTPPLVRPTRCVPRLRQSTPPPPALLFSAGLRAPPVPRPTRPTATAPQANVPRRPPTNTPGKLSAPALCPADAHQPSLDAREPQPCHVGRPTTPAPPTIAPTVYRAPPPSRDPPRSPPTQLAPAPCPADPRTPVDHPRRPSCSTALPRSLTIAPEVPCRPYIDHSRCPLCPNDIREHPRTPYNPANTPVRPHPTPLSLPADTHIF